MSKMLDALKQIGVAERSMLILTADHGGQKRRHGHGRPADLTVPWLVYGAGVEPRRLEPVCVTATAGVAAAALGIEFLPAPTSTGTSSR